MCSKCLPLVCVHCWHCWLTDLLTSTSVCVWIVSQISVSSLSCFFFFRFSVRALKFIYLFIFTIHFIVQVTPSRISLENIGGSLLRMLAGNFLYLLLLNQLQWRCIVLVSSSHSPRCWLGKVRDLSAHTKNTLLICVWRLYSLNTSQMRGIEGYSSLLTLLFDLRDLVYHGPPLFCIFYYYLRIFSWLLIFITCYLHASSSSPAT